MKNLGIKAAIQKLENANIQVSEYKESLKLCGYELNTYTDAGVNMIIFLDFRDSDLDPLSGKHFIKCFEDRIESIDITEELQVHSNEIYMRDIGFEVGYKDFKDWKENLSNIFSTKTPQQRQYEQVVDKFRSLLSEMEDTLKLMPIKDNVSEGCQRTHIATQINNLDYAINGIELEDFTPNEYSRDFKLSYS